MYLATTADLIGLGIYTVVGLIFWWIFPYLYFKLYAPLRPYNKYTVASGRKVKDKLQFLACSVDRVHRRSDNSYLSFDEYKMMQDQVHKAVGGEESQEDIEEYFREHFKEQVQGTLVKYKDLTLSRGDKVVFVIDEFRDMASFISFFWPAPVLAWLYWVLYNIFWATLGRVQIPRRAYTPSWSRTKCETS